MVSKNLILPPLNRINHQITVQHLINCHEVQHYFLKILCHPNFTFFMICQSSQIIWYSRVSNNRTASTKRT